MTNDLQQWYIRREGVIHGPASEVELQNLIQAGRITLEIEASEAKEGPWHPLAEYGAFTPVRPISELFASEWRSSSSAPPGESGFGAEAPLGVSPSEPAVTEAGPATTQGNRGVTGGRISTETRKEFVDGLTKEVKSQITDKCIPGGMIAFSITLIGIARFSIVWAFVLAFVIAGIVHKIIELYLEEKWMRPIANMSDEMLVSRYDEAKADRRAARTRTAISWAVIVIVGVVLGLAWLAAHRP